MEIEPGPSGSNVILEDEDDDSNLQNIPVGETPTES